MRLTSANAIPDAGQIKERALIYCYRKLLKYYKQLSLNIFFPFCRYYLYPSPIFPPDRSPIGERIPRKCR